MGKVDASADQSSTEEKVPFAAEGQLVEANETHNPSDAKSLPSKGPDEGTKLVHEDIKALAESPPLIRTSSKQSSIVQRFLEATSRNNSRASIYGDYLAFVRY